MTYTYDLASAVGQVRLLIRDNNDQGAVFDDEELTALLTLEDDAVILAAARALEVIGGSETRTAKRIRLLDLTVDGTAVAEDLRRTAQRWREEFYAGLLPETAELVTGPATLREHLWNEALRSV